MSLRFLKEHGFEPDNLKAVLFDMDGVLYDSMPNHAHSWVEAACRHGLKMTPQMAYLNEGRTGAGTINALALEQWGRKATEEECELIYKDKSAVFNSCPLATPMPGALEALTALRSKGIDILIVTGSGQQSLLDRLNASFPGFFARERMVTAFDVRHGKPDPEPYLMGLKKAGVEADQAIVVENAPLGVQAGRAAGIFTIAVNTGPLPDSVLAQAGANVILPNMTDLATKLSD